MEHFYTGPVRSLSVACVGKWWAWSFIAWGASGTSKSSGLAGPGRGSASSAPVEYVNAKGPSVCRREQAEKGAAK